MPTRVIQTEFTLGKAKFLRTDIGTEQLNVNGLAPGGATVIWNGEGTFWTLEANGTAETYAAKNGTYGLDSGVRSAGQETRFDYGSNQDIAGLYQNVKFWMQPKAYPTGSQLKVLWRTAGGNNPGSTLLVQDYVPNMDLDVWQEVTIPIADFALGADVAKLVLIYGTKGGQQFYFDDFELVAAGAGGPYTFRAEAPAGRRWHVGLLNLITSAGSTGWNSNAFANISGGLAQGLILRKKILSTSEVKWSFTFKNNVELFGQLVPSYDFTFGDGELMVNFSMKPDPASLVVTDDEVLEFLVRDNLSSLTNMRAYIHYGEEEA
jgi:hypothetical protein